MLLIASQWVQYARLVRAQVLALREREFVLAARAIGVKDRNIILSHLLPNLLGPVIVLITLNVANNILLESSLTFLGLGVDPTIPSWGGMLADGRTYLQTAWWVSVFPGLAILLTVLGVIIDLAIAFALHTWAGVPLWLAAATGFALAAGANYVIHQTWSFRSGPLSLRRAGLYALVALNRDSVQSTEAAMKARRARALSRAKAFGASTMVA